MRRAGGEGEVRTGGVVTEAKNVGSFAGKNEEFSPQLMSVLEQEPHHMTSSRGFLGIR